MQDGYRILGSGKSGKMAKIYQHHKFPPCLGYPKHEGKDEENLTHFFGHYQKAFPGRIVAQPVQSVRRDTLAGMQDAVVDLFCLSRTRKLLGSYWSSFSDMAAELSGIPLQIVKTSHP